MYNIKNTNINIHKLAKLSTETKSPNTQFLFSQSQRNFYRTNAIPQLINTHLSQET